MSTKKETRAETFLKLSKVSLSQQPRGQNPQRGVGRFLAAWSGSGATREPLAAGPAIGLGPRDLGVWAPGRPPNGYGGAEIAYTICGGWGTDRQDARPERALVSLSSVVTEMTELIDGVLGLGLVELLLQQLRGGVTGGRGLRHSRRNHGVELCGAYAVLTLLRPLGAFTDRVGQR